MNQINFIKTKLKIIVFGILLLSSYQGLSQTKIDNNLSINFPSNPLKFNSIESNVSVNAHYLNSSDDSYIVLRMVLLVDGNESTSLASSEKVLNNVIYKNINGQISAMNKKGFSLKDSLQVKVNDYFGYKLIYIDPNSGTQNAESLLLFLNGISYVITYSKVGLYSEMNKEKFFDSLKINKSDSLKQIEDSKGSSSLYSTLIAMVLVLGYIIWLSRINRNKSPIKFARP